MLLVQETPFTNLSIWDKYGIQGLIIGFLLITLVWFVRWVLNRTAEQDERQQKFLESLLAQHKSERIEWRDDVHAKNAAHQAALKELHERTLTACDKNTDACQELAAEIRALTSNIKG